jgi:hypothetical protein
MGGKKQRNLLKTPEVEYTLDGSLNTLKLSKDTVHF